MRNFKLAVSDDRCSIIWDKKIKFFNFSDLFCGVKSSSVFYSSFHLVRKKIDQKQRQLYLQIDRLIHKSDDMLMTLKMSRWLMKEKHISFSCFFFLLSNGNIEIRAYKFSEQNRSRQSISHDLNILIHNMTITLCHYK